MTNMTNPSIIESLGGTLTTIARPGTQLFNKQEFITTWKTRGAVRCKLSVRYDDDCKNGRNYFHITGETQRQYQGQWQEDSGGSLQPETYGKFFPELVAFNRWHGFTLDAARTQDIGNAVYLAGDLDYNGKRKGEPWAFKHGIKFGNSPITYVIESDRFYAWLQKQLASNPGPDFEVLEVPHPPKPGDSYQYSPQYTFKGYDQPWHGCPFSTRREAEEFTAALKLDYEFVKFPHLFSEGKERQLSAARSVARWPDLTDQELCLPRVVLTDLLQQRWPTLVAEFEADMARLGLLLKPAADAS